MKIIITNYAFNLTRFPDSALCQTDLHLVPPLAVWYRAIWPLWLRKHWQGLTYLIGPSHVIVEPIDEEGDNMSRLHLLLQSVGGWEHDVGAVEEERVSNPNLQDGFLVVLVRLGKELWHRSRFNYSVMVAFPFAYNNWWDAASIAQVIAVVDQWSSMESRISNGSSPNCWRVELEFQEV